jgi:mRNA interferase MazF
MRQGDVILVRYPFTDGTGSKVRPALVISTEEFNNGEDVIVSPISSVPDEHDPYSLFIGNPIFSQAGLLKPSAIKWTKVATVDKGLVHRTLGQLPSDVLEELLGKLRQMFG